MKNFAILAFGIVVGMTVVLNSSLMQEPKAQAQEEVATGHRITPMGQSMITYAGARAQVVAF